MLSKGRRPGLEFERSIDEEEHRVRVIGGMVQLHQIFNSLHDVVTPSNLLKGGPVWGSHAVSDSVNST
jgi:hypothetical protein